MSSGAFVLRTVRGRFDACRQMLSGSASSIVDHPSLLMTVVAFLAIIFAPLLPDSALHALPFMFVGATGFSSSATTVSTLSDLYVKANTTVKIATKLFTEEQKWFRSYPKEDIVVSGNENRIPLVLTKPRLPAWITDGGNEGLMTTPAPTHGTFSPTQMNKRHGYTGLAQAFSQKSRSAMIEDQTTFQANMSGYSIGRAIGLSTYGTSVGTLAVVRTSTGAGTTHVVPLKNAYGNSTFVAGNDSGGVQDTYLSALFPVGGKVAWIRAAAIVEFGTVTASPSATSGQGYVDITSTSSITSTAGDLLVSAEADGDSTITGTDYNNWSLGFTDILLSDSVEGQTTTSYAAWAAGSAQTAAQRLSFVVKKKMIHECFNASGMTINRFILPQGVERDAIAGELGGRRYDGSEVDIEGSLKAGSGEQYFVSQLALPNTLIGWFDRAVSKIELSDNPDEEMGKSLFKLDKVQGKSQIAAGYDYFQQRVVSSRAACGYAANLTSS